MDSSSGSSFGIDTILSSASGSNPPLMTGDFRPGDSRPGDFRLGDGRSGDFRSRSTPSPCSDIDTVGTGPSSPVSGSMEPCAEAHLAQDGLQHLQLHHGPQQNLQSLPLSPGPGGQGPGPGCAPRSATSSFLIKDILGDSNKPLAACAPYSTSVSSPVHTPKPESATAPDGFRPKLEQEDTRSKLDKRDELQNELKCNGKRRRRERSANHSLLEMTGKKQVQKEGGTHSSCQKEIKKNKLRNKEKQAEK